MATTISNGESGSSVRTKLNNIWEGLQINEIASTIADTAVDVFVYDTRKDSDGGAWRKRTQHTSWYNETLNTATRGSRKEFPAVAVIVAESDTVTIYDGDDPDLPMWMVFSFIIGSPASITSVKMLQGKLVIGSNLSYSIGLTLYDFSSDSGQVWYTSGNKPLLGGISDRPANSAAWGVVFASSYSGGNLVNAVVNDVAMTVLPNAPIDAATGLPAVTTAVATDGGVSVIKDDGTVVDITAASHPDYMDSVAFDSNGDLIFTWDSGVQPLKWVLFREIPSADVDIATIYTTLDGFGLWSGTTRDSNTIALSSVQDEYVGEVIDGAFGTISGSGSSGKGLFKYDRDYQVFGNSLVNNITSSYNTGWMNGDIKLATLSDTDDTDVTGSELVTNGTFDTDTSGWTASALTTSVSSGQATLTMTSTYGTFVQGITTVVGKTYTITCDIVSETISGALYLGAGTTSGGSQLGIFATSVGSNAFTFTATGTTTYVALYLNGASSEAAVIDNFTARLAEEDRSVNGNGLQVFGTVTKDPVSSGADLVAYSGFSASNYLEQPYNSDLDFGTGDFCVMGWYKTDNSTTTEVLLSRVDSGNTAAINCMITSSETLILQTRESSTSSTVTTTDTAATGVWNCFAFVRRNSGTVQEVYINGKLSLSGTVTARNVSSSTGKVYMGYTPELAANAKGSMALWRISATAPSPEQIKKIYEDEKVLFQEGAQATLYGESDAVTALAYDDSTELLHVGTSAGRSVFQGLRRVDNTTTAVGAAISASNGLVADE
jgi:hypothetical protein